VLGGVALLALSTVGVAASARSAEAVPANRVTVITDSVGGVLYWDTEARVRLARGLDLDLETKTCRRLVDSGCPAYDDPAPASALETIKSLGAELGPAVVIDVGYNDRADVYGAQLDEVMGALLASGVHRVVWVTLTEAQESWTRINAQIRSAPARWPQLVVADWARAATEESWFVDRVHMTSEGGLAFAEFLRPFALDACGPPCAPPPPLGIATLRLPTGRQNQRYAVTLAGRGGVLPYRWAVRGLPPRMRLSADGRISGIPVAAGTALLRLDLRDAWDEESTVDLALRVRG